MNWLKKLFYISGSKIEIKFIYNKEDEVFCTCYKGYYLYLNKNDNLKIPVIRPKINYEKQLELGIYDKVMHFSENEIDNILENRRAPRGKMCR